ncbi:MAG TPA: hypothetical protein VGX23_24320 [Actinocrinis sp.]|nr:hypothetical protein [Actinocrinis sp.]
MSRRRTAGVLAVVLGLSGLAGCSSAAPDGAPSPAATASATPNAGAIAALARLDSWFDRAGTANTSLSTVLTSRPANPLISMMQLSGPTDVLTGATQLQGGRQQSSGANTEVDAVSADGEFYSTVPPRQGATGQSAGTPPSWTRTALTTVQGTDSVHSIWWLALHHLDKVHLDGPSTVGKNPATEYTGTVDLSTVPGIPASVLQEPFFKETGSTELSVDLYTDMDTGALVQLTYRMGLKVSIDAVPTTKSLSGFQVDLSDFGAPTALPTPVVVPAEKYIVSDGNDDLCLLLFF